ncbi:MAG TPA: DMT family protein, partial [Sphingomonadaceae bacterium]|nr:DMT family protein [Sphingomonadaceae bacterium]
RSAMPQLAAKLLPIVLLIGSNVFMTIAWYGHLKFKDRPLMMVILISWGIALIEYCLAVPANRYGSDAYSVAQLKAIQEVITLTVFAGFSILYLGQKITPNHIIGFTLIAAGAFFVFRTPIQPG